MMNSPVLRRVVVLLDHIRIYSRFYVMRWEMNVERFIILLDGTYLDVERCYLPSWYDVEEYI
jgi:hypothetical protein